MFEFLVGQIVGFLMGLGGSFLSWWVLTHFLTPKVEFGSFVSRGRYGASQDRPGYRIKFVNSSERDIYEVVVVANVVLYGIIPLKPNNNLTFKIPLNLSGNTELFYAVMKPKGNRVARLSFEVSDNLKKSEYLPKEFRDKVENGNTELEELLNFGDITRNKLFLYVIATDYLSGSRKVFRSKDYKISDIISTTFDGLNPKGQDKAHI